MKEVLHMVSRVGIDVSAGRLMLQKNLRHNSRTAPLLLPMKIMQLPASEIRLDGHRRFYLKRSRRQLPFPASPKLRIAQISATANRLYSATVFASGAWHRLGTFRPQVLIGSSADIQLLAERAKLLGFDINSIDHAIVVLTSCPGEILTDVTRVVLWQTFGVPVYEMIFAFPNLVLASECVAHEGWHLESGVTGSDDFRELVFEARGRKIAGVFSGELITQPCPCGRPGLRLMNLAAPRPNAICKLAAIA